MKHEFTTRHFLAALAWLGLTLAPLVTPAAMAAPVEMAAVSVEGASMDMPEGMPCCPDAQKRPDCGKDCPFMALCSGQVFPPIGDVALPIPVNLSVVVTPRDDAGLGGLAHGPPARPPKV